MVRWPTTVFRARGVYAARDAVQHDHGNAWLDYLGQYKGGSEQDIADAMAEAIWMMAQAIGEIGNRLLGRQIFQAHPIGEWVGSFLLYASRVQDGK